MTKNSSSYQEFLACEEEVHHLKINYKGEVLASPKLKTLKALTLFAPKMSHLPDWLRELTQLEYLDLSYSNITELPTWFSSFTQLQTLHLQYAQLKTLPNFLFDLEKLETLDLTSNQLEYIPSTMTSPSLKKLLLEGNNPTNAKELLEIIRYLPALEQYTIPFETEMDNLKFHSFFTSLCKKRPSLLNKTGLHPEQVQLLCHLFLEDKAALEQAKQEDFYYLLNCTYGKYREMALEFLLTQHQKSPVIRDKKLFVSGQLTVPKAEQEIWIEETGAIVAPKFTPNVDYILLGNKPGKKLSQLLESKVPILLEQHIWALKDSKTLLEETPEIVANLQELLQSSAPENLELAFQIMGNGGLPKELEEEIMGLMLFHTDAAVRKKAKVLFKRFVTVTDLPTHTQALLNKQACRLRDDKKITEYLHDLVDKTTFDLSKLAYAAYRYSDKIQAQGLCLSLPNVSKKVLPDYINSNGTLVLKARGYLANGLYLDVFPADIEGIIPTIKELDLQKFKIKKEEEFKRLNGLKKLIFNNEYARKVSPIIFENTTLEKLDLSLYRVKKIPPVIGQLIHLKELKIYATYVNKLPKEIQQLSKIERLNLSLEDNIFPAFILQLQQLQSLYIGSQHDDFPDGLEKLPALQRVNITLSKDALPIVHERYEKLQALLNERKRKAKNS